MFDKSGNIFPSIIVCMCIRYERPYSKWRFISNTYSLKYASFLCHVFTDANRGAQNEGFQIDDEITEHDTNFSITVHGKKPPVKTLSVNMLTSGEKPAKYGAEGSTVSVNTVNESSLSVVSSEKGSSNGTVTR